MRHQKRIRKLGRKSKHFEATRRNLVCSLFKHGRVKTTYAKARAFRPFAEKLVTLAKKNLSIKVPDAPEGSDRGDPTSMSAHRAWVKKNRPELAARMHNLRNAIRHLQNKEVVDLLFNEIAERFANRPGGYTRIIKLSRPRLGDCAPQVYLELVGVNDTREGRLPEAKRRKKRKGAEPRSAEAAAAVSHHVAPDQSDNAQGQDGDDAASPKSNE